MRTKRTQIAALNALTQESAREQGKAWKHFRGDAEAVFKLTWRRYAENETTRDAREGVQAHGRSLSASSLELLSRPRIYKSVDPYFSGLLRLFRLSRFASFKLLSC